jgi:hypothetical protein
MAGNLDAVMWQRARTLMATPDGLAIDGLGVLRNGKLEAATGKPPPTGYDAPRLVVQTADELGVDDKEVRSHLRTELKQALASAAGRPAPLGPLGLIEVKGGRTNFYPSRRTEPAPPDAIETALTAWRAPADTLGQRVGALVEALGTIRGALSPADQRRLLDEVDYELDEDGWAQFGGPIVSALPF